MRVVVSRNENGTAAITTPVVQEGETEAEALDRVLAEIPGGEPLSAELVVALRAGDAPTARSCGVYNGGRGAEL